MANTIKGNGVITGTDEDEIIIGGNGDDEITGGRGNDTITGGRGTNTIIYRVGDGNDVINLTRGENLTLEFEGFNSDNYKAEYSQNKRDLLFYPDKNSDEFITIKNFAVNDPTSSINVKYGDFITDLNEFFVVETETKTNFKGSRLDDEIRVSDEVTKGLVLDGGDGWDDIYGGKGNDTIYGGNDDDLIYGNGGNDVIFGGNGDDEIYGGTGNDTITGGAGNSTDGHNIIYYRLGDGNDLVNLTKGEKLEIHFVDDFEYNNLIQMPNIGYSAAENGRDLIIYVDKNDKTAGSITLKDYLLRDVTNNATRRTPDTSYIKIVNADSTGARQEIDLKDLENLIITTEISNKNFTGSRFKDEIDASNAYLTKKVKNEIIEKSTTERGLTLNGGLGEDTITGSKYSDIINGGDDNDSIDGGDGNDTIYGGNGEDIINGEDGNDVIYGGNGKDTIDGGKGNDKIYGDNGDDSIKGGEGNDIIYGGNGKDAINGDEGDDLIYGGNDDDIIDGGKGNDKLYGDNGDDYINGGEGDDTIYGGNGEDTIYGDSGNDLIYGGSGNDMIYGDDGNDTIYGDAGDDTIYGGKGNDKIYGGDGNDLIYADDNSGDLVARENYIDGGRGNDTIYGGVGKDIIYGGDGNDKIYGDEEEVHGSADEIHGGNGNDEIYGYAGDDTIYGDNGNDTIYGGTGNDKIYGGNGKDLIYGGEDNDYIDGGNDDDTLYGDSGDDTIYGGNGNDEIHGGDGNDELHGGRGNDTIYGDNGDDLIFGEDGNDLIYGGDFNDTIDGGNGNDIIYGGEGDDSINGGLGNDTIYSGEGFDTILGGKGNDTIYVQETGDKTLVFNNGDGNDTVYIEDTVNSVKLDFTGIADTDYLDNLSFTKKGNDLVIDHMYPNRKGALVSGGTVTIKNYFVSDEAGNINLNNIYVVGTDGDFSLSDLVRTGVNILGTYDKATRTTIFEGTGNNDILINKSGSAKMYGGFGDDSILGGNGNDEIHGGDGNDELHGGRGNDTIYGDNGDDLIFGEDGNDLIYGGDFNDTIYGGNGNDIIYGEEGGDSIDGGNGNDIIYGGEGDDSINGGLGNDTIYSGEGYDTILGGKGNDTIYVQETGDKTLVFNNGDGNDTIFIEDTVNTVKFDFADADYFNNLSFTKKGNDLVIDHMYPNRKGALVSGGTITIKDYFDESGNIKYDNIGIFKDAELQEFLADLVKSGLTVQGTYDKASRTTIFEGTIYGDTLVNKSGSAKMYGGLGDDYIIGGNGNDTIDGGNGDDYMFGGDGNDIIYSGEGDDYIDGGRGNDEIHIQETGNKTLVFRKGDGNDIVQIADTTDSVDLTFVDIKDINSCSFTKKGNDLVIDHLYSNRSGGTVTIKDYFEGNYVNTGESTPIKGDSGKIKYDNISISDRNGGTYDLADLVSNGNAGFNITGVYNKEYRTTEYYGTEYNDIFNHKSGAALMYGGKGDDTYNIDINKTASTIYENGAFEDEIDFAGYHHSIPNGGGNDTLNINAKENNLALVFNVNRNGKVEVYRDYSGSDDTTYGSGYSSNESMYSIYSSYFDGDELFIFNKNSLTLNNLINYFFNSTFNGVIEIDDYFEKDSSGSSVYSENQYGYIENINAKDNKGSYVGIDMDSWINQVAGEVANWLNDHGYGSTADVIDEAILSGYTSDINSLLKVYQTGNYQG